MFEERWGRKKIDVDINGRGLNVTWFCSDTRIFYHHKYIYF